ncbi:MAG: hypothetical protein ACW99G_16275 [Candidatus Thorarchaeota archaeon]|jgi:hypothetical protein
MACTAKQQSISLVDTSEFVEFEEQIVQTETNDEESRKYRKHIAQREALRQLEQRKTHALASTHRISFMR